MLRHPIKRKRSDSGAEGVAVGGGDDELLGRIEVALLEVGEGNSLSKGGGVAGACDKADFFFSF